MEKIKKENAIKIIVENPPTKEHVQKKLKDVSEFLSKELSKNYPKSEKLKNHTF